MSWPLAPFPGWDFAFCVSDRSAMSEIKTDVRKGEFLATVGEEDI